MKNIIFIFYNINLKNLDMKSKNYIIKNNRNYLIKFFIINKKMKYNYSWG